MKTSLINYPWGLSATKLCAVWKAGQPNRATKLLVARPSTSPSSALSGFGLWRFSSRRDRDMRPLGYMNQWCTAAKKAFDQASIIVQFLCLLHVTDRYIISSTHVQGPSMLPTLNLTGDVILAEHLSHRFGKIELGDVVLVRSPRDPKRMVTKRVLGLEGHRVTFSADPFVGDSSVSVVVPKGHVWIQGDNLYASTDSRYFGPIPYGLIQGKALLRVWPPEGFGPLE